MAKYIEIIGGRQGVKHVDNNIIKHFTALGYFQYSRTPVTSTLKGNKKQLELAGVQVIGVHCKIQFAMLKNR